MIVPSDCATTQCKQEVTNVLTFSSRPFWSKFSDTIFNFVFHTRCPPAPLCAAIRIHSFIIFFCRYPNRILFSVPSFLFFFYRELNSGYLGTSHPVQFFSTSRRNRCCRHFLDLLNLGYSYGSWNLNSPPCEHIRPDIFAGHVFYHISEFPQFDFPSSEPVYNSSYNSLVVYIRVVDVDHIYMVRKDGDSPSRNQAVQTKHRLDYCESFFSRHAPDFCETFILPDRNQIVSWLCLFHSGLIYLFLTCVNIDAQFVSEELVKKLMICSGVGCARLFKAVTWAFIFSKYVSSSFPHLPFKPKLRNSILCTTPPTYINFPFGFDGTLRSVPVVCQIHDLFSGLSKLLLSDSSISCA